MQQSMTDSDWTKLSKGGYRAEMMDYDRAYALSVRGATVWASRHAVEDMALVDIFADMQAALAAPKVGASFQIGPVTGEFISVSDRRGMDGVDCRGIVRD